MSGIHYSKEDLELVRSLAADGMTAQEIADKLGRSVVGIRKTCTRYGIQLLYYHNGKRNPRFCGSGSRFWKGGSTIDKDGYRLIHIPEHPFANNAGYVREHRLLMENVLCRYLTPLEVVHHKDGNKLNNHPDNIELFSRNSEHLKVELTGKCPKWSPDGLRAIQQMTEKKRRSTPYTQEEIESRCERARIATRKYRANQKALKIDDQQTP